MNRQIYSEIADILLDIEMELRRLELWASDSPPPHKLQSVQPFCIDTLDFHEWLQFVFISKVKWLIENEAALPAKSDIAPMAEEYFKAKAINTAKLTRLLGVFDELISAS